jgi:FrmR/RcnR family transcriptional regulator, repressor of frmRAB operon
VKPPNPLIRVRRIRGQIDTIERALENGASCSELLQIIAGVASALNSLIDEVLEKHIRTKIVDPANEMDAVRAQAIEDLLGVIHSYWA